MNKTIKLNYGKKFLNFELPNEKISWTASPKRMAPVSNIDSAIKEAIRNPIECETIQELVDKYGKKTVIIIDDFTRTTPIDKILPIIIEELKTAGVRDDEITILIALGTHRAMTTEECIQKVGKQIFDRIKVENHKWYDPEQLIDMGNSTSGIPIKISKIYYESDISIAIGNVIPHIYAGWSAGAKLIQPGVSGADTTAKTHLLAANNLENILGNEENNVIHEMEEIAKQTGLKMIINTVMNTDGTLVKVFAGDVVKAHRACVHIAKKIYTVDAKDKPDLIICSSYPAYYDLWQSVKAMTVAAILVKKQGTVILVSPAMEGDCPGHPEFVGLGIKSVEELNNMIENGLIKDEVSASVNMTVAAVRELAKIIVVTEFKNKMSVEKLGLNFAIDIDDALKQVELENIRSIGIITHGADLSIKY